MTPGRAFNRSAERAAQRRADAIASGKCQNCKRRRSLKGKSRCRPCLDYQNEWQKKHYAARQAAGKCPDCGSRPPAKRRRRCALCQNKNRDLRREWEKYGPIGRRSTA